MKGTLQMLTQEWIYCGVDWRVIGENLPLFILSGPIHLSQTFVNVEIFENVNGS